MSRDKAFTVGEMVNTAVFAAVICAVAPFAVPIGPVPLSLATFIIYIAAGTLGLKSGVLSVVLYVLLGVIGAPVFTNFEGGFHKVAGATGGFIIGYVPCAAIIGVMTGAFGKKLRSYILGMVLGTLLLYTCGVFWFVFQTGNSFQASLLLCVLPFLPGDAVKIVASAMIAPRLRSVMRR